MHAGNLAGHGPIRGIIFRGPPIAPIQLCSQDLLR
jgi:hypothetical protein